MAVDFPQKTFADVAAYQIFNLNGKLNGPRKENMPVPCGIKTFKTVVKGLSNHDNDSYNVKNDSYEHKNSSMTHATRFFNTFI